MLTGSINTLLSLVYILTACRFAQSDVSQPGYLATFPSTVIPNSHARFCIRFLNVQSDVQLTLEDDQPSCFEKIERTVSPKDDQTCFDVFIQSNLTEITVKDLTLAGKSVDGGNYTFNNTKRFTFKPNSHFSLIETDKPVYKPGDKVNIRILSLDYLLRPKPTRFSEVFVTDSSGSRVSQWLDVNNKNGLIDLSFPLSEEPNLGFWSLEALEKTTTTGHPTSIKVNFEVKKYVLPKFEVTIDHKKTIVVTDQKMNVSVCAKYSYGKDVKGRFDLTAYTRRYFYGSLQENINLSVNKSSTGRGCVHFEITLNETGIHPGSYMNKIYFNATVVEQNTEIEAKATSNSQVSFRSFEAELIEPNYYKPGFAVYFKILVKSADGIGLPNEVFQVKLEKKDKVFYELDHYTTKNGYLMFSFDPNEQCNKDCSQSKPTEKPEKITLRIIRGAAEKPVSKERKIAGGGADFYPSFVPYFNNNERTFQIDSWYTEQNSYLQIFKSTSEKQVTCESGQKLKFRLVARSLDKIDNQNVYFQIQARSGVQLSGYFSPKLEKTVINDHTDQSLVNFQLTSSREINPSTVSSFSLNEKCKKTASLTTEDSPFSGVEENEAQIIGDIDASFAEGAASSVEKSPEGKEVNNKAAIVTRWVYDDTFNECVKKEVAKDDKSASLSYFTSFKSCHRSCILANQIRFNALGVPVMSQNNTRPIYEYSYQMEFNRTADMSPEIKLLVFLINRNEIIPDSISFKLPKCYKNKVEFSLGADSIRVGRRLDLTIKSEPRSICAVSAIDKSVTFMGARNTVNSLNLFDALSQFEMNYDYMNNYEQDEDCEVFPIFPMPRPMPMPRNRVLSANRKRAVFFDRWYSPDTVYDSTKSFKESNVIFMSDLDIARPTCQSAMARSSIREKNLMIPQGAVAAMSMDLASSNSVMSESAPPAIEQPIRTIRQFFPETWLWSIEVTNKDGVFSRKEKAPDSITDWVLDAYCLSNSSGVAVSETKTLRVFQPLFISVNLPYSAVRGELFPVKVAIFNYETTCVPIELEMLIDQSLTLKKNTEKKVKLCVCPEDEIMHTFYLQALTFDVENGIRLTTKVSSLNETDSCRIDQIVSKNIKFTDSESRNIIIEPEGVPKEQVESILAVFKDNQTISKSLAISLPENTVKKSSRFYLSVIGDSIGPALKNLDNLVQQPTGCGEQNMVKFAPIISILSYLTETQQLVEKMNELARNYLKIGYQRQLTYRHQDGSFSAFGPSHTRESGGTWLTAFVLRSFADSFKANYIQMDPKDVKLSLNMLMGTQDKETGCFKQVGAPLFSKAMAGGLSDKQVALSAYVTISVLKATDSLNLTNSSDYQPGIAKGLEYLKSHVNKSEESLKKADTYTLSLILYAFKLAKFDSALVASINTELDSRAKTETSNLKYWTESSESESTNQTKQSSYWIPNRSADLEITSYILLCKLYDLKRADLSELVAIAKWINSQRNSLGGFYSTQDTVVALDALARFSSAFYAKNINMRVSYSISTNSEKKTSNTSLITINQRNRLLVQKIKLDGISETEANQIELHIEGQGTSLVQLISKYNVESQETNIEKNVDSFEFSVFSNTSDCKNTELNVKIKYTGEKKTSDSMIIAFIRLPTGWEAVEQSVQSLEQKPIELRRYELKENRVSLYFDSLTALNSEKQFKFQVNRVFDVKNTKPGLMSVYDYYEPLDQALTQQFEIVSNC